MHSFFSLHKYLLSILIVLIVFHFQNDSYFLNAQERVKSLSVRQFEIEESLKERIILGQDDIDITLGYANQIKQFESNRFVSKPWLK